jgi:hypothetical protein
MKRLLFLLSFVTLTGCAYSIAEIDTSKAEPNCIRQCAGTYSQCVSSGPSFGAKTETLRACRESYSVCVSTCPPK